VSLRTWLINGFRYVVLDALKWYKKEYGSITFEDYLRSFDVTSDLRLQFNRMANTSEVNGEKMARHRGWCRANVF
jgi:hypothetical protein